MVDFIITFLVLQLGLALFIGGMFFERFRWSKLIEKGILPKPRGR